MVSPRGDCNENGCKMNKKILSAIVLTLCCVWGASAQRFALKTNALYWAATTPNIGAEMAVSKHSTISLSANYNPWTIGETKKIQHWFIQPEYRYWLTEKFTRAYFGAHLIGGQYEVGGFSLPGGIFENLKKNYYKGSFVGLGVSFGYHFYISPHWNLETAVGVGVARTSYHAEPIGSRGGKYRDCVRYLPIPTQLSVSFVYLFNDRK